MSKSTVTVRIDKDETMELPLEEVKRRTKSQGRGKPRLEEATWHPRTWRGRDKGDFETD